jgi:5-methylcytosine-specific restriction enzyme A
MQYDKHRGSSHERGYGSRWRKYRESFLQEHPLCKTCGDSGILEASTVVDHIIPHQGDPDLFWNPDNHQALCTSCHSRKTAKEDGGFGNVARH